MAFSLLPLSHLDTLYLLHSVATLTPPLLGLRSLMPPLLGLCSHITHVLSHSYTHINTSQWRSTIPILCLLSNITVPSKLSCSSLFTLVRNTLSRHHFTTQLGCYAKRNYWNTRRTMWFMEGREKLKWQHAIKVLWAEGQLTNFNPKEGPSVNLT